MAYMSACFKINWAYMGHFGTILNSCLQQKAFCGFSSSDTRQPAREVAPSCSPRTFIPNISHTANMPFEQLCFTRRP